MFALGVGAAAAVTACDFRVRGALELTPSPGDDLAGGADGDGGVVDVDAAPAAGNDAGAGANDAAVDAPDAAPVDAGGTTGPVRIHVNGAAYTGGADFPGDWAADPGVGGVCNGNGYTTSAPIRGTTDDALFQNEMVATTGTPLVCTVRGLANGKYTVTLLFAEIYFGRGCPGGGKGTGARVFDIYLEGVKVLDKLDLYAVGHCAASSNDDKAKPVIRSFEVAIGDGTLDISMPASVDHAKISAIEIVAVR
jgi:hypothetical protein